MPPSDQPSPRQPAPPPVQPHYYQGNYYLPGEQPAASGKALKRKQPSVAIIIAMLLMFFGWFANAMGALSFIDTGTAFLTAYLPYLGLFAILTVISMVGLAMVKRWGLFLYIAYVGFNIYVLYTNGITRFTAGFMLALPGIAIVITLFYFKELD